MIKSIFKLLGKYKKILVIYRLGSFSEDTFPCTLLPRSLIFPRDWPDQGLSSVSRRNKSKKRKFPHPCAQQFSNSDKFYLCLRVKKCDFAEPIHNFTSCYGSSAVMTGTRSTIPPRVHSLLDSFSLWI